MGRAQASLLGLALILISAALAGASAPSASAAVCFEKFAAPGSAFFGDAKILLKSTKGFEVRFECGHTEADIGDFVGFKLRANRSITPREVTHSGFSHLGNCQSQGTDLVCRAGGAALDIKAVLKTSAPPCDGTALKLSLQPERVVPGSEGETYFGPVEALPSPCSHGKISLKGLPSKCVSDDFNVRVTLPKALQGIAANRDDAVRVKLDGKTIARAGGMLGDEEGDLRLTAKVRAEKLKSGRHKLLVDSEPRATRSETFRRC